MKKKVKSTKSIQSLKSKILIFGYYKDKNNKTRYGFVKQDGRKKQNIIIKRGLDSYKIANTNKKKFKKIRTNIDEYLLNNKKQIQGIKIEKIKKPYNEIEFVKSKEYEVRGKKRIRTSETKQLNELPDVFYSMFKTGIELNARLISYSCKLNIKFAHRKKYNYKQDYWIFSQKYLIDLNDETIKQEIDKIFEIAVNAMNEIFKDYEVEYINIINEIAWEF